jgi:hypothetical protein
MSVLTTEQFNAIEEVIRRVREKGGHQSLELSDGSEAYAEPTQQGVVWGVNGIPSASDLARPGQRIAHGIRPTRRIA